MGTPMRLATFALALLVVFIAAWEIGSRTAPAVGVAAGPASAGPGHGTGGHETDGHEAGGGETGQGGDQHGESAAQHAPEGLAAEVDSYRLTLLTPRPAAREDATVRFRIDGPDGAPVTEYQTEHGKQLHLIVVRRDLASFQHVHPVLDPVSGTWTATLDTTAAGDYRLYADMLPAGRAEGLTLGTDFAVAGQLTPVAPATADSRVAEVDGYRVELSGDLRAGQAGTLTATVTRDGRPVTDLDPYLEAYGHLVALRQSDLAYLHVHPDGHPGDGTTPAGPTVTFGVDVPTDGVYRLFLDVSHGGVVRTAPFVLVVGR